MKERSIFLYIVSLTAIVLSFAFCGGAAFEISTIILALVAIILTSVALLLDLLLIRIAGRVLTCCAFALTIFAIGPVFVTEIWPRIMVIVTVVLLTGFSLYFRKMMERNEKLVQAAIDSAAEAEDMKEMAGSQRKMVKSTEHTSRLEERNRLAARIHDEIGHGMSGSILLLEGADMIMDSDPEKARETIHKVTESMRDSVEKIRKVLREERSASAEVSLARIKNELVAFSSRHEHIKTRLDTEGNMEDISSAVWVCVYENMLEALTNMLKHSPATLFSVSLKNIGGLFHVEFSDNGGTNSRDITANQGDATVLADESRKEVTPGIGLQNMEDRAAEYHGRCFFRHEEDGFHIVMTFPRRGGVE